MAERVVVGVADELDVKVQDRNKHEQAGRAARAQGIDILRNPDACLKRRHPALSPRRAACVHDFVLRLTMPQSNPVNSSVYYAC